MVLRPWLCLLVILRLCAVRGSTEQNYTAVCVICRNENKYIREWIEYHKCIGVSKFYVYDHESASPVLDSIQDHVSTGLVKYKQFSSVHTKYSDGFTSSLERFLTTAQGNCFRDCIENYSQYHQFMGFIDIDEYVVFHNYSIPNINSFLRQYESYGGVSLYWVLFGSSGHKRSPEGMVIRNYMKCLPRRHKYNTQFKSFVNTKYKPLMYSPHRAMFNVTGGFLVDENFKPIPPGRNKNCTQQQLAVYHYATKSQQDFQSKLHRGGGAGVTRPRGYLNRLDRQTNETCYDAIHTYQRLCNHTNAA